jgi:tetratricopeptide (TPR) repeat protein
MRYRDLWLAGISVVPLISTAWVPTIAFAKTSAEVGKTAQAIAVQIEPIGGKNIGSGTILQKQGDIYTVLTAAHVLRSGKKFKITTADGRSYQSIEGSQRQANSNLDLAVLSFRSSNNYSLAKLGSSQTLSSGMPVYVAGFPAATTTINAGVFNFTKGEVSANASKANQKGYSLIYSNPTLPGMSGGPVLNDRGELVAIHGQGDRSDDGQKTGFNLGIVIERSQSLVKDLGVLKDVKPLARSNNLKPDDYLLSGNDKFDRGNYQGALADYNQAIQLNPKYAEAYNNRGNLRTRLRDARGALADYNRAISLRPNSNLAYLNRGVLKDSQLNDYKGALADYDKCLSFDPQDYLVYNNRGLIKDEKLNDVQGALADYNQAITLNPRSALAYNNRGNLQRQKLQNVNAALADYQAAIKLAPRSPMAYYNRADLNYFSGDRTAAVQDFTTISTLPSNDWLVPIAQGMVELEQGRFTAALNLFNKAGTQGADSLDRYKYRGLAYSKLGNRKAAIADWQKALQICQKLHYTQESATLQKLIKSL